MSTRKGQVLRTKAKANDVVHDLPHRLALITHSLFQSAFSTYPRGCAYLQALPDDDRITQKNGRLYYDNFPLDSVTLSKFCAAQVKQGVSPDLPLLRVLYSIILDVCQTHGTNGNMKACVITVYIPELWVCMGKSRHTSKNDLETLKRKINELCKFVGVIKSVDNTASDKVLPLLRANYDDTANTLQFVSPYMQQLIYAIQKNSIKRDKDGRPKYKKNGDLQTLPSHSYLILSSIAKERNKPAVEVVCIVVAVIEQTGGPRKDGYAYPHLKVRTIIQRCPILQQKLDHAATVAQKDKILHHVFQKAWELLRTKTRLTTVYPDIYLPSATCVADIPTSKTLDQTITFYHRGKSRSSETIHESSESCPTKFG